MLKQRELEHRIGKMEAENAQLAALIATRRAEADVLWAALSGITAAPSYVVATAHEYEIPVSLGGHGYEANFKGQYFQYDTAAGAGGTTEQRQHRQRQAVTRVSIC